MREVVSELFLKDNAANIEQGFLFSETSSGMRASSNSRAVRYSMHNGETGTVRFSKSEVDLAISLGMQVIQLSSERQAAAKLTLDHARLARAMYWSQAARAADDVAGGIALYCTALETLASTTSSELTHQLSERIAYLIASSPQERMEVYTWMKKSYAFRSKMVHGEPIRLKQADAIIDASKMIDSYTRSLFWMILNDVKIGKVFDLDNEKLHQFMIRLTLGAAIDDLKAENRAD